MNVINVRKYGLKGNGSLETSVFQSIIDKYSSKENIIYFPKGKYVLSTVFLRNNTHIKISKFAKILGSSNFYDFERDEKVDYPLYQDASHSFFRSSLFVGENVEDISIVGKGTIDMQSIWDEDNIRNIVHRGNKTIALKRCKNVKLQGIKILNSTDLAVYFAGCENVVVDGLKLKVYIDGISPDNSKHVEIKNCHVIAGDDGIVFKSSYTLNELGECDDIKVKNCRIESRCNAIKFGTESNGGFKNIFIQNISIKNTRITGVSIESVDGAIIDNIHLTNLKMRNVNAPIFVHLGKRLRGPAGSKIGKISNVFFKNISAKGPYKPYKTVPWNYLSYKANDVIQYPWIFDTPKEGQSLKCDINKPWQFTSNICGLENHNLENICLSNVTMQLFGGVLEYQREVKKEPLEYPEVYAYGKVLPASGLYVRNVVGLGLKNINIRLIHKDKREKVIID